MATLPQRRIPNFKTAGTMVVPRSLLVPQRHRGVNAGCPTRRLENRRARDCSEQHRCPCECEWVGSFDAIQKARDDPRQRKRSSQPDDEPHDCKLEALAKDEPEHISARGSDRHPDTDLMRPFPNRMRNHTVDADRRQKE